MVVNSVLKYVYEAKFTFIHTNYIAFFKNVKKNYVVFIYKISQIFCKFCSKCFCASKLRVESYELVLMLCISKLRT